jgi:hypothetical protein
MAILGPQFIDVFTQDLLYFETDWARLPGMPEDGWER